MSDITDIVDVQITANTKTPSRQSFASLAIAGYHTKFAERMRTYTRLSGITTDGFTVNHPLYKMALSAWSQNPRLKKIKIVRLDTASAWRASIIVAAGLAEGDVVSLDWLLPDGTTATTSYTLTAGQTTNDAATALEVLIEALTGIASSVSSATITATGPSDGTVYYVSGLVNCTFLDTTADVNVSADLDAARLYDDDWYGLAIVPGSEANNDEVAGWAESNDKLFGVYSYDDIELTAGGTQGSGLAGNNYERTFGMWNRDSASWPQVAWLGKQLPKDPGSSTWQNKELAGVQSDELTPTEFGFLEGDRWNYYQKVKGLDVTQGGGIVFSGQYIDVRVGIDWIKANIVERVWARIAREEKIPYTDAGVAIIVGEVQAVLDEAVRRGILNPGDGQTIQPPLATGPRVADVDDADKADRLLPDIEFSGTLAGGIHKTQIQGVLSL